MSQMKSGIMQGRKNHLFYSLAIPNM